MGCEHTFDHTMPWKPTYSEAAARKAISSAETWADALALLDRAYHGKNIATLRKWTAHWGIPTAHLPPPRRAFIYSEEEARAAIAKARSWAEALRILRCCPTGGNPKTLKKRAAEWGIATDHFDAGQSARSKKQAVLMPLSEILVEGPPIAGGASSNASTTKG
jgi:hypothetical protein